MWPRIGGIRCIGLQWGVDTNSSIGRKGVCELHVGPLTSGSLYWFVFARCFYAAEHGIVNGADRHLGKEQSIRLVIHGVLIVQGVPRYALVVAKVGLQVCELYLERGLVGRRRCGRWR